MRQNRPYRRLCWTHYPHPLAKNHASFAGSLKAPRFFPFPLGPIVTVMVLSVTWAGAAEKLGSLTCDSSSGTRWTTPAGVLALDKSAVSPCAIVRFEPGGEYPLPEPKLRRLSETSFELSYRITLADQISLDISRKIKVTACAGGAAVVEQWILSPSRPISADCEIQRCFAWSPIKLADNAQAALPLKNGWLKATSLTSQAVRCEYRLGHALGGEETLNLALPVVALDSGTGTTAAVMMDPTFSSLIETQRSAAQVNGTIRFRYLGSRVPISAPEERRFAVWIDSGAAAASAGSAAGPVRRTNRMAFAERTIDAFFALMLADVPPGPAWLHDIAMVYYDYLSDNGQGWDRDLKVLACWLKPEERRRVALCLHGWYDAIGSYCFDATTGQMKKQWVAFQPTRQVRLSQDELIRRLRTARELGFRALLYFGDGLASDSGVPSYRDDWAYRDAKGEKIAGWQGPDTVGKTYILNPAHPEVIRWYLAYVDALLKTYGAEFDGLVWDETFHARLGQIATKPQPAYCDRAMMALIKEIARRVHAFDTQKVFLVSDCIGLPGFEDVPGYAMVAHGTWQDSWCHPVAWSYGFFPDWRNVLWSCNWQPVSNYHFTRWAVRNFNVPVAISNGWGDDLGPSEWSAFQRDEILRLFRQRLQHKGRVRYLAEDPAGLMARGPHVPSPGDPLPAASSGLVNWALASQGSRATASSEQAPGYPAKGVIDGVRTDAGWGSGHGWASAEGMRPPHWLEVDFAQPRPVSRLIVITYERDKSMETGSKWGILDYQIQAWTPATSQWQTIVTECQGRAAKVRVHPLDPPVTTPKIRLLIHRVAPLDGRARLLQFEAWGPARP